MMQPPQQSFRNLSGSVLTVRLTSGLSVQIEPEYPAATIIDSVDSHELRSGIEVAFGVYIPVRQSNMGSMERLQHVRIANLPPPDWSTAILLSPFVAGFVPWLWWPQTRNDLYMADYGSSAERNSEGRVEVVTRLLQLSCFGATT